MKKILSTDLSTGKRMALYARVSTQEQTKKDYPSCESQIEELEAFCLSRGWQASEIIKDEGYSAGPQESRPQESRPFLGTTRR